MTQQRPVVENIISWTISPFPTHINPPESVLLSACSHLHTHLPSLISHFKTFPDPYHLFLLLLWQKISWKQWSTFISSPSLYTHYSFLYYCNHALSLLLKPFLSRHQQPHHVYFLSSITFFIASISFHFVPLE